MSPADTSVGTTPPAPDGGVGGPISLNKVASTGAGLTFRERTIEDRREDARRGIAYLIVGCFVITILGSFWMFKYRGDDSVDDIIKLIQAIIAPVVAIVGAVTGFYFSSNISHSARNERRRQDISNEPE